MSETRRPTARRIRRAAALVVGGLVVALLPFAAATGAPSQGSILFDIGDSTHVPATPGSDGLVYVVAGESFDVQLTFLDKKGQSTVLSNSEPVPVVLKNGTATVGGPKDMEAGSSSVTFTGVTLSTPATDVVLTATATTKQGTVSGDSPPFDVLIESNPVTASGPTSVGGEDGIQGDCNPTPNRPVCGDLFAPADGFVPGGELSQGCRVNVDCLSSNTFVQAIAAFTSTDSSPATLLMNCDKSLCGGGAIKKQTLKVTLSPNPDNEFFGEVTAPACSAKGTVTYDPKVDYGPDNRPFCVDYVQSTRDIAGDTILYLLFVEDAKVRFP